MTQIAERSAVAFRLGAASICALALVAEACNGDSSSKTTITPPALAGMYRVSTHTRNTTDCSAEGAPAASGAAYFRVVTDNTGITVLACTSQDTASCPTDALAAAINGTLLGSFDNPLADGWSIDLPYADRSSGCRLTYSVGSFRQQTDGSVRLEMRDYSQQPSLAVEQCTAAEAKQRGTSMPCEQFVVYTGKAI